MHRFLHKFHRDTGIHIYMRANVSNVPRDDRLGQIFIVLLESELMRNK